MVETQAQVIEWAMKKLESYDNEKKLYNLSAIILSILDVICGAIAIFYTSMIVTSVVASIICGTIWGGRFIQLVKAERLAKALKILSTASLAYIAARKKRSDYMKNFFKNIKNNPIVIIVSIIAAGIMAFVTYNFAQTNFSTLPTYLYIIFAVVAAIITIFVVVILGWDSVKGAILRKAKKHLSADDYDKVVNLVVDLEKATNEAKKEKAQNAEALKKVEQAKVVIANYDAKIAEQNAQKIAYDEAKKVLADFETKQEVVVNTDENNE